MILQVVKFPGKKKYFFFLYNRVNYFAFPILRNRECVCHVSLVLQKRSMILNKIETWDWVNNESSAVTNQVVGGEFVRIV